MLKELLGSVLNQENQVTEDITVDEENVIMPDSTNASERHLLEYENDLNNQHLDMIGVDISLTLTVNGAYMFWILNSLNSLTPDFVGWAYHILSFSLNSAVSLNHLAQEKVNRKYLLALTVARLGITQAINSSVINKIDKHVQISKENKDKIIAEIKQFEGFKEPKNEPININQISIVACVIIAVITVLKLKGNRQQNDNELD